MLSGLVVSRVRLSIRKLLNDNQGRKFADVVNEPEISFETLIDFFNSADRQRRMEDSEIHHDRAPLAGVIRELESQPEFDAYLRKASPQKSMRLRQAVGVLVRMVMEELGWNKTGKKGSLGVRISTGEEKKDHNTGGLSLWFLRAERYQLGKGMPFRSVQERCDDFHFSKEYRGDKSSERSTNQANDDRIFS